MKINYRYIKEELNEYFNLLPGKEEEQAVIEQVKGGIVFRGTNLWILMFAILIASLGLNVNSTAVIIGAMLISPLMGPIIGMGLSVGISDLNLLKQSLKNYGVATLISVVTATVYFLLSPLNEAQSELLARTSPTLYDVLIAFFGGAAGVLALTTKSKGQVIPGVAIATALMPPLCTAGYGLATAQWPYFFGAFYLFFINTVFIATATFLGVKLLRFHTVRDLDAEAVRRSRKVVYLIVLITMIPAAFLTANIVRENVLESNKNQFVKAELHQPGTQILSSQLKDDTLRVVAVGKEITDVQVGEARARMQFYGLEGATLMVIQAENAENLVMASSLSSAEQANAVLSQQVADLQRQLEAVAAYDTLSSDVTKEAHLTFEQIIQSVAIGKLNGKLTAVVTIDGSVRTEAEWELRVEKWLRARAKSDDLDIVFRYGSYPVKN